MKLLYGLLVASLLFINTGNCFADEKMDKENDIILKGDISAAVRSIRNLRDLYEKDNKEGKKAIESAVPAVAERLINILDDVEKSGRYLAEGEGEFVGDLIRTLSVSGDMRAKNALLKAMASPHVGGTIIAKGLLKMGPQVLPDIIEYVDNENIDAKRGAISTLSQIYEKDTNKTFFSDKDKKEIKEKLLPYLSHDDEILKWHTVNALGYFGDDSVIPLLEKVKENDNPQTHKNIPPNSIREAAKEAISRLKEKKD